MKMTDWIDGTETPIRAGIYKKLNTSTGIEFYSFWTGLYWGQGSLKQEEAESWDNVMFVAYQQEWPWRGLAEQPK